MTQGVVQSVDRAMRLLWEVHDRPGISLTEASGGVGLLPSTALRLLSTLEQHGVVERDRSTRGFRVGANALALGSAAGTSNGLIAIRLEPAVRALAAAVREQVSLAVLAGRSVEHMVTIDGADLAGHELLLRAPGARRDTNLNATALGKVFLAFAPEHMADELIGGLSFIATAGHTITEADKFRRDLKQVRRQGYAYSIDENTAHVAGVAAPVTSADRTRCVAAVAVHGPSVRLTADRLRSITPTVTAAGEECSQLVAGLLRLPNGDHPGTRLRA